MAEEKPKKEAKPEPNKEAKPVVKPTEGTQPKQTFEKQYTVAKIGWEGENPVTPIVLLDKKERDALQLGTTSMVKVKKVGSPTTSIAIVQLQFKQLVGLEVATLNTNLARKLGVAVNDKVEIVKGVLESEAQAFRQSILSGQREVFMEAMTTDMGF